MVQYSFARGIERFKSTCFRPLPVYAKLYPRNKVQGYIRITMYIRPFVRCPFVCLSVQARLVLVFVMEKLWKFLLLAKIVYGTKVFHNFDPSSMSQEGKKPFG